MPGMSKAFPWPMGRRAAVSLTYDDAMPSQLEAAAPDLVACGLRGTFFLSDRGGAASVQAGAWAGLPAQGHELAAHTLNHPCSGARSWLGLGETLEDYDEARMQREFDGCDALLRSLGSTGPFTYAYTCGDTELGNPRRSYVPMVRRQYLAARSVQEGLCDPWGLDLHLCPTLHGHAKTGAALRALVDSALEAGVWAVFMFHGIDSGTLSAAREDHLSLLRHVASLEDRVWTAPFGEVASMILGQRGA
jgi:hypothetical protein